jgi:hypothetical protein
VPRFYIDTFNAIDVRDEEGRDLPDLDAVREEVRRTLAAMMHDGKAGRDSIQFRADVRNEVGQRVLTAAMLMVMEETSSG